MRTHVVFDNDITYELTEQAVTAFFGYTTATGTSYRASVGALLDGGLEPGAHDFDPGFVVAVGATHQWPFGDGQWFVAGSVGLSVARASTHMAGGGGDAHFTAGDARGGAIVGRTFGRIWNPYVLARGFGGPVWWTVDGEAVSGTDTRHFQLGAGLSVSTPIGLTVNVDVSALGEQAASLGATWRL
ncbi:MAG TPA: hypothetical protein VL326_07425 [Kofleriaceae bacterium]|jgi:hypothetical protein|nr:hypothetical protein [Kofleriaceae bacterium]